MSALWSGKVDQYEQLIGEEILAFDKKRMRKQVYLLLVKYLKKKTVQDQGDQLGSRISALEEHGKQLVKSSIEKECFKTFETRRNFWRNCQWKWIN